MQIIEFRREFRALVGSGDTIEQVPIVSIDSFLKQQEINGPISFIKIDVQGYELAVCKGASNAFAENPSLSVAFEYAPDQISELGFNGEELLQILRPKWLLLYSLLRTDVSSQSKERTSIAILLKSLTSIS